MSDEIEAYIQTLLENYQSFKTAGPLPVDLALKNAEIGQMLACVGKHTASLEYLQPAWSYYLNNFKFINKK